MITRAAWYTSTVPVPSQHRDNSERQQEPRIDYSRKDVRRMLAVTEARLRSWERQELIPHAESYSFQDLIALRALQKLSDNRIAPKQIARALASLKQKLSHINRPLNELKIASDGRKLSVLVAGQKMEALSGQLLFDFDASELPALRSFPQKVKKPAIDFAESERWFQRGLALEETGASAEACETAYLRAVQFNPAAAGALVNLGTIQFRQHKYPEAEDFYRRALQADPSYTLALFNLGNLCDERGRTDEARELYQQSLKITPQYADAHFNLALLSERSGDPLRAVAHWKAYLKLDSSSSWAKTARRQLDRLKQTHGW
jgi:tetratricopeptide (TPR) repeat protein